MADLKRYKATEFRQILLYTGPVIFLNKIKSDQFEHFLMFSIAIRILSTRGMCQDLQWNTYANGLLRTFVENSVILYGEHFATYNVHGLNHLAADVLKHGPLDGFSAFPFENYLCLLKKTVRKFKYPLQQVVRREVERRSIATLQIPKSIKSIKFKKEHSNGPILSNFCGNQFQQP